MQRICNSPLPRKGHDALIQALVFCICLIATPILADDPLRPMPRPCLEDCPLRTLRTLGGPVPNLIGDADDLIGDRATSEPEAATPYDPEAVGPTRDIILQRLGRDAPANQIGHY